MYSTAVSRLISGSVARSARLRHSERKVQCRLSSPSNRDKGNYQREVSGALQEQPPPSTARICARPTPIQS